MTRLVALVLCAAVGRAAADPPTDAEAQAKAADESARRHYELREYSEAIAEYRRAYEALPDALFLFDIAQAYRQLGDCDNARVFYRNYLRERPDADNRDKVEQFITEMDACAKPAPHPQPLPPPTTAAPMDAPAGSHGGLQLAGSLVAAAGLVVTGVAIYYSVQASNRASDLEAACANGCDGSAVASIDRAGQAANRDAIVSYVIGGVAIATGASLFAWARLHAAEPVVTATPAGATAGVRVRF
ncbi:MAG TPA: hypothetical protein VMJ10_11895 [Kofleriaceae bacterium]|nr:hypothetical protein [Kofleriaceae bacterium]